MGGSPDVPDPYETADAQGAANLKGAGQSFWTSNIDETNPYASRTYSQSGMQPVYDEKGNISGYAPHYTSNTTLSAAQQELLNKQNTLYSSLLGTANTQAKRLDQTLATPINQSGWQAWNAGPEAAKLATTYGGEGDYRQDQSPTDRQAIEQATMGRYRESAGKQAKAEDTQLAARGLSPGGQGYGQVADTRARSLTDASQQAYLASGQESRAAQEAYNRAQMQRSSEAAQRAGFSNEALTGMFNMGGSAADRQNALRQSQMTEELGLRNQGIGEILSLAGMAGPTTPSLQPYTGTQVSAPNIGQMIYDSYNAEKSSYDSMLSGMFGVGKAAAGAMPWASWLSDRRAKQDIEPTGDDLAGVPLYHFRYKAYPDVPQIGVMADEAKIIHPDAVFAVDGYDHVNYEMLNRRHTHG
jgi:hypothetical protein